MNSEPQNQYEYTLGYHTAIQKVQEQMNRQIKINFGARTPLQVLNAWNGLTLFVHQEEKEVREFLAQNEPKEPVPTIEEIMEVLNERFPGFEVDVMRIVKEEF